MRRLVHEEADCSLKEQLYTRKKCEDGSKPFRVRRPCSIGSRRKAQLICEKRSKGGDDALIA